MTNGDLIFQAVIAEPALIKFGDYNPDDYTTLADALDSENNVVAAVAKIIYYQNRNHSEKEIYTEVTNYLKDNVL